MSWRKLKTVGNETWIHVHVVKYPTAISMSLVDEKTVEIQIESAYIIDAFSDAIVTVDCKEDDVDDSDLDEEIIMNVNPHYLEEKNKEFHKKYRFCGAFLVYSFVLNVLLMK